MIKLIIAFFALFPISSFASENSIRVLPGKITGFEPYPVEKQRLLEAFEVIERVVNSEEFKFRVITRKKYTLNRNLSNEEIYASLLEGREIANHQDASGEMNLHITRYYKKFSRVIGRTNAARSLVIEANGKFYRKLSVAQMASNIVHEWTHLLGFSHADSKDHDSVPYAVGYLVEELANKYLEQGFIE